MLLPDYIDPEVWETFIEYRKEIKAKFTPVAQKMMLTKLRKLKDAGYNPNACLTVSMEKGWTGVFPITDREQRLYEGTLERQVQGNIIDRLTDDSWADNVTVINNDKLIGEG